MSKKRHLRRYTRREPPPQRSITRYPYLRDVEQWDESAIARFLQGSDWKMLLNRLEYGRSALLHNLTVKANYAARGITDEDKIPPKELLPVIVDDGGTQMDEITLLWWAKLLADAAGVYPEDCPGDYRFLQRATPAERLRQARKLFTALSQALQPENVSPMSGKGNGQGQGEGQEGQEGQGKPGQEQPQPGQGGKGGKGQGRREGYGPVEQTVEGDEEGDESPPPQSQPKPQPKPQQQPNTEKKEKPPNAQSSPPPAVQPKVESNSQPQPRAAPTQPAPAQPAPNHAKPAAKPQNGQPAPQAQRPKPQQQQQQSGKRESGEPYHDWDDDWNDLPTPRYDDEGEQGNTSDRKQDFLSATDAGGQTTNARTLNNFQAKENPTLHTGAHGGGEQIRAGHPEDASFWEARRAIEQLCVAPDPLNKPELGQDVYDIRRIAKSRYNPAMLSQIRREVGRTVDDVYIVLDTSGSVEEYAEEIASIAAAAAGIVHLFSGSEARPEFAVDRNSPLAGPGEKFHEWEDQRSLQADTPETAKAFETFRTNLQAVNHAGLDDTIVGYRGSSFETDVAWWLEQVQPPKGSHIIFWTDTQGCGIVRPRILKALLSDYHVTLMVPMERRYVVRYEANGDEEQFQSRVERGMDDNGASNEEVYKFLAMEIPVLYGVTDGVSFAEAIRKIK